MPTEDGEQARFPERFKGPEISPCPLRGQGELPSREKDLRPGVRAWGTPPWKSVPNRKVSGRPSAYFLIWPWASASMVSSPVHRTNLGEGNRVYKAPGKTQNVGVLALSLCHLPPLPTGQSAAVAADSPGRGRKPGGRSIGVGVHSPLPLSQLC